MSGRKCGNCRHYEPSPIWRSGWCRNPRLYGPHESHLVRQEELACAHRIGNYWEPVEDEPGEPGGSAGPLGGLVKPLRLFGPGARQVALASGSSGAGGGGPFSSGGAGGSGSLSSSGAGGDRGTGGGGGGFGGPGGRPPGGDAGRPDRSGRLPGQERIVSYQPEERYWSDYLRIALPVVGLLLMLGLFWFWAANLIGDDDDDNPGGATITPTNETALVTPTATQVVVVNGTEGPGSTETEGPINETPDGENPTETPEGEDPTETPEGEDPTETPDGENPPEDGVFAEGDIVIVNSDGVRFRSEPRVADETFIRDLDNQEELTVTGDSQKGDDGIVWVPVVDADGEEGWVSGEFLVEAE
jgi:hypothetical protein